MEKQIDIDISNFNKTKDINIFDKILSDIGLELNKCKYCNEYIIYYDTNIGIRNKKIKGKSNLTKKIVNDNVYNLCVCEKCLVKKFKEYENKNKSRNYEKSNIQLRSHPGFRDYDDFLVLYTARFNA